MPAHGLESDPLWYKDAIIYEVHVKAFFDSNNDGIGDFPGLIEKLDYLADLGITCVWLLPFYPSPLRDDGYDISDYHGVHPAYGTLRDFRTFVRRAHQRGIRVITELVINHTSDQHPWFQASRAAPPGSSKRNFYVWSDTDQKYKDARIIFSDTEKSNWTWDPVARAYYWHRFFHHQPDLNFDNPRVLRAVLRILRYWMDMDVDGMRLDAVPYLVEREGTTCENLPETHAILKEIRRHLDARYRDRMLLAEANAWPVDVLPYFGDGDECHVAFHFPLMTRLFMALRQEDRHPITDILRQTPEIPESCQWALFLRNHDELTLEMVTDEERDYMYREYATDPRARLNLGIRRRLGPLVAYSRRRMELLNALLHSLPGTPVIYYGDEIGMGDNIYLGDRDGVRTPMQWSGDRNGGFSRADFARLYSAPIMDPISGYQAVNIEAQQRDPSSLLNWMKRLIALRKQFKTFGRGTLDFLYPRNRKVLAYLRRYQDEVILVVANLSRFTQPAELELAPFEGLTPVEMFGRVEFPVVRDAPYFMSLAPHSFCWFQLEKATHPITVRTPPVAAEAPEEVPLIPVGRDWRALIQGHTRRLLENEILPPFLKSRRWFLGRGRSLRETRIADWTPLDTAGSITLLLLVEAIFADGAPDLYHVPLGFAPLGAHDAAVERSPYLLARVKGPDGQGVLYDALGDDRACRVLVEAIQGGREFAAHAGSVRAFPTGTPGEAPGPAGPESRVARPWPQSSNTLIQYGDRLILKLFRRIEPGCNPELELLRHLTERAGFTRVPRVVGAVEYLRPGVEPATLALVEELVPNQGGAWERTIEELRRFFERAAARLHEPETIDMEARTLADLLTGAPQAAAAETIGATLGHAATLGQRAAELHLALATSDGDPAFVAEPLTAGDLDALSRRVNDLARSALAALEANVRRLPGGVSEQAHWLLSQRSRVLRRAEEPPRLELAAGKIRCHGNYGLSDLLWVKNDFVIVDFEGDPALPMAERRAKQSPLADVASMLRSLAYAAHAGLGAFTEVRPDLRKRLEPWARLWQTGTWGAFLQAYTEKARGAAFLPAAPGALVPLLELFLLEKTLRELVDDLENRPEWAPVPLEGILQLLGPGEDRRRS